MAAVTIKQIANHAGVSIGTVDRALHGRSGVNAEVAKRILEIADMLGYKPNMAAKALSKKTPTTIGVVFHVQINPFFESVAEGIRKAIAGYKDFGFVANIRYGKDFCAEDQLKNINELLEEGVDALIVVPLNDERVSEKLRELKKEDFPVVLLLSDLSAEERFAYVGCNAYEVGWVAAGIMGIACGGKGRILYATSPLQILGTQQRLDGFTHAIRSRYPEMAVDDVVEFENDEIQAYKKAVTVFSSLSNIDGIMVATGSLNGFFQAFFEATHLHKTKLVTLDLSNQVMEAMRTGTVVASVVQHPTAQGREAVQILIEHFINGRGRSSNFEMKPDIKIFESLFEV